MSSHLFRENTKAWGQSDVCCNRRCKNCRSCFGSWRETGKSCLGHRLPEIFPSNLKNRKIYDSLSYICTQTHTHKHTHTHTLTHTYIYQGKLKREVSLNCWPRVWWVWKQLYDNWQFLFLFTKQTNTNQSNRGSMVQWYFPLIIPYIYIYIYMCVYCWCPQSVCKWGFFLYSRKHYNHLQWIYIYKYHWQKFLQLSSSHAWVEKY